MKANDKETGAEAKPQSAPILIDQYRIFADFFSAEKTRDEGTNRFFLAVNTAIVAAVAIGADNLAESPSYLPLILYVPAIFICLLWWATLRSIGMWTVAQLETLQEIERQLPIAPFTSSWYENLANRPDYLKIRTLRQVVPWVFIGVYTTIIGATFHW